MVFPVTEWSLTITKNKSDVALNTIDILAVFMEKYCLKGGISTEVGSRVFQLHLQGVLRLHWPKTEERIKELQKFIKAMLPERGKLYRVNLKPLQGGQTFVVMLGYCTKDAGKPHYQLRTHNVSRMELATGRKDHDAMMTSYDDAKKILNVRNIFNECFKFTMRSFYPVLPPIHYVLLYMIQSGGYMFSSDFITVQRKTDFAEAKILWDLVHDPRSATIEDVMNMIFNPRSYGPKESKRYYMAGVQRLDSDDLPPANTLAPDEEADGGEVPMTRVNGLIAMARSSVRTRSEAADLDEFEKLPSDTEQDQFTIDRQPSECEASTLQDMQCPDNLEDMLAISGEIRRAAYLRLHPDIETLVADTIPVVQQSAAKTRPNNFIVKNMADL